MPKTALITGGGRGLGRAIADNLVHDHYVALSYFSDKTPGKIFVCKHPGNLAIYADFRDPDEPAELVRMVASAFGKIDAIVNAATLSAQEEGAVDPARRAEREQVNRAAPAALLAAALPHMPQGSAVLNIAACPAGTNPETTAALRKKTRAQARMLAEDGIRANTILPAPRGLRPETAPARGEIFADVPNELAAAARYLLSDAATELNGEVIAVGIPQTATA